eukprot:gene3144-3931_t
METKNIIGCNFSIGNKTLIEYVEFVKGHYPSLVEPYINELSLGNSIILQRLLVTCYVERFFPFIDPSLKLGHNVLRWYTSPSDDDTNPTGGDGSIVELHFTISELYLFDRFYLEENEKIILVENSNRVPKQTIIDSCFTMVDIMEKYYRVPTKESFKLFKEDLLNCYLNYPFSKIMITGKQNIIKEECRAHGLHSIPEYVEMKLKSDPNFNCHLFYEQFHSKGHPTNAFLKIKRGFTKEEVLKYSPEFSNSFETQLIGIHKSKGGFSSVSVGMESNDFIFSIFPTLEHPVKEYFKQLGLSLDDYYINFVHPWQLKEKVFKEFVVEIKTQMIIILPESVSQSIKYKALIPVRSMAFEDISLKDEHRDQNKYLPTIKVSLNVCLTSMTRYLPHWSSIIGPIFSNLLVEVSEKEKSNPDLFGKFYFVKDIHGIYWDPSNYNINNVDSKTEKSALISSLWREDINQYITSSDEQVVAVPALFNQSFVSGKLLLLEFIEIYKHSHSIATIEESILEWFRKYCQLLINPYITLFCKYGISLEAHHQNTYCVMKCGEPIKIIFKDFDAPRFNKHRLIANQLNYKPFEGLLIINETNPKEVYKMSSILLSHFCEFIIIFLKELKGKDVNISEMSLLKETYLIGKSVMDKLKLESTMIKEQVLKDEQYFFGSPILESYSYNKWRLNPTPDFSNPPLIVSNPWYHFHNNLK